MEEESAVNESNEEKMKIFLDNGISETRKDDIVAFQAVICIIAAIIIFGMNFAYPEICREVTSFLMSLIRSKTQIIPNIIDAFGK
jgi:hypothetical protein